MYFGYGYYDWTMFLIIPCIILSFIAQARVNNTFKKYSDVTAHCGLTARQVARQLLDRAGLQGIAIERAGGRGLSDHYDPRDETLHLSSDTMNSESVAAIGVAAHEVGHAIQHAEEYSPLMIRNSIVPVVNIASYIAIPLLFIGFALELAGLTYVALALYGLSLVFYLITLPVEFDASRRARQMLVADGVLSPQEDRQAGKVLSAAAMTYIVAAMMSALQFLRLLGMANRRR